MDNTCIYSDCEADLDIYGVEYDDVILCMKCNSVQVEEEDYNHEDKL